MKVIDVFKLAKQLQRYKEFRKVQLMLHERRKKNEIDDILLTLQYRPVFTVGNRGPSDHFVKPVQELIEAGLDVEYTDRGGEVTYHGPGQIVMYPIIDLRQNRLGARLFVEKLENVMISLSASYGLKALGQIKDKTGVWIGSRKIGAIGVRISAGISSHGTSFNVNTALDHYQYIKPCGFTSEDVTTLAMETGAPVDIEEVEDRLIKIFSQEFWYHSISVSSKDLITSTH